MRTVRFHASPVSVAALGAAVLWGVVEFVALGRARLAAAWQRVTR